MHPITTATAAALLAGLAGAAFAADTDALLADAKSAAPDEISNNATVMDWEGNVLKGRAPAGLPGEGQPITASVRLEKLGFHSERPETANAVQGRVVNKTFLGSRMAMQIAVGEILTAAGNRYLHTSADLFGALQVAEELGRRTISIDVNSSGNARFRKIWMPISDE